MNYAQVKEVLDRNKILSYFKRSRDKGNTEFVISYSFFSFVIKTIEDNQYEYPANNALKIGIAFENLLVGKKVKEFFEITEDEQENVLQMVSHVENQNFDFLQVDKVESFNVPIFFQYLGLPLRNTPDIVTSDRLIDFKTTSCTTEQACIKSIDAWNYDLQGFLCSLHTSKPQYLLFVSKKQNRKGRLCYLHKITKEELQRGEDKFRKALQYLIKLKIIKKK